MLIGKNQFLFTKTTVSDTQVLCNRTVRVGEYTFFLGEDCLCTHVCTEDRQLVLLGYCLHSLGPALTCHQMCLQLLSGLDPACANAAEQTLYWGGRWVAFAYIGGRWNIWGDACGLKQCFCRETETLTAATQARYISQLHSLAENPVASEYIRTAMEANPEYCWPTDTTLYPQVMRLLPNHIWRQGAGHATRMETILFQISTSSPAESAAQLLRGAVQAAANHKPLVLTLTAGWDSRLVLAACQNAGVEAQAVTLQYTHMLPTHPDITVASQLATKAAIPHHVLLCHSEDGEFAKNYMDHSENAHTYWMQMAQQTKLQGFAQYLWTKGACNEILRNPNGILRNRQISKKLLCKLFQLPQTEFVYAAISRWLVTARPYCEKNGISLLDLFYWEHRMGSWLAECLNEADVSSDMFSPFNVRAYLCVGAQVSCMDRIAPNYSFFADILQICAPSCMQPPINSGRYGNLRSRAKLLLKYRLHTAYGLLLRFCR